MKVTIISDTHGQHEKLGRMSGDVLIHCGDMFNMFSEGHDDFERMDAWFGEQDFELILCTGGNHDFELEQRALSLHEPFANAHFLHGGSYEHRGVVFFGAPWIPDLNGQAFFKEDDVLAQIWSRIPDNVDVLITHTPPAGILDVSSQGLRLGCRHLLAAIERAQPRLHCFGHVHASSGIHEERGVTFVNAALVNRQYRVSRQPYELEL